MDGSESTDLATVTVELQPRTTLASLAGEIDYSNAEQVYRRLAALAETVPELRIDLSGLQFIDSAGVATLVRLATRSHAGQPPHLWFVAGQDTAVAHLLVRMGLTTVLPLAPSEPDQASV